MTRSAALTPPPDVVYVDVDPVVAAHNRALRSIGPGLDTILADIRRPETVLDHPGLQALIDFNKPVGVVIFSVLDVIEDKDNPLGIFRQFRERMTPGSYLGISHLSARSAPDAIAHTHNISQQTRCRGSKLPARRGSPGVLRRLRPRGARSWSTSVSPSRTPRKSRSNSSAPSGRKAD